METAEQLSSEVVKQLDADAFTYSEVGATAAGREMPVDYHHLQAAAIIGSGDEYFRQAREALLSWQVQLRSGIRVASSSPTIAAGTVARLTIGVGPIGMKAPVRVIDVLDEPRHVAFTYGTLPGHPESGEELFGLRQFDDGLIEFEVRAFSRHQSVLTKLGGPAGQIAQKLITKRYLAALKNL
ncbi:hypothetical protein GOEFS_106_00350 [Gordonia effusa NBRC 100432]|uniref:DUF1990 domain-containing protein n=1 Tax=Gordonia effusa NBRC 100432 TaxID=1077974 RepID=H0R4Y8_9ACTN|nr:DUF1990 domain-containing protein [Gordonia effusa]GAB20139.1 hypothetical protein GOEFS_106_00350 [Gordonia effusa NBRC 100432]